MKYCVLCLIYYLLMSLQGTVNSNSLEHHETYRLPTALKPCERDALDAKFFTVYKGKGGGVLNNKVDRIGAWFNTVQNPFKIIQHVPNHKCGMRLYL